MATVRDFQGTQRARNADSAATIDGAVGGHSAAIEIRQQPGGRARGSGGKSIIAAHRAAIVNQHDRSAAYAGRIGFDEREHGLGRDRGVHGATARAKHGQCGPGGQRIGRGGGGASNGGTGARGVEVQPRLGGAAEGALQGQRPTFLLIASEYKTQNHIQDRLV